MDEIKYNCFQHFFCTHIILMTEHYGPDDLKDVFSGDLLRQAAGVLLELLQDGVIHILEDQVQFPFAPKNLNMSIRSIFCLNFIRPR